MTEINQETQVSQFFQIHPETPQVRLIQQAVEIIRQGGVIVYPTDSAYALGCHLGDKKAMERIKRIRQLDDKHNFTLVCRDLAEISTYARVDNQAYRTIKAHTPGAYTFILNATSEVPRRLLHAKRRTIGIRIPDNQIALALTEALGEPIMSTSLILPGEDIPLTDPYEIRDMLQHQVDLVIDGGYCGMEATSVISLLNEAPEVVRKGAGEVSSFE
ncbi:threonylcarbamoyl-AMP synthase [Marinobacterium zhoushanense]|uniref:Threonylcarbamoyl-AMP synthase n=1 Tax=Marinobacterium zhoushanense TaxID=1679163 RepID=A0ABQ1K5G7_9GAMM|nr:threonylcarbamoyl-AMP synthase [Marinobacterium zhoushanense]